LASSEIVFVSVTKVGSSGGSDRGKVVESVRAAKRRVRREEDELELPRFIVKSHASSFGEAEEHFRFGVVERRVADLLRSRGDNGHENETRDELGFRLMRKFLFLLKV